MANGGQGTGNGGGGGTSRVTSNNATANLSQMQALAQKSGAAADQQLATMLIDASSRMNVKTDANQQDTDTQRFANATGMADKKPIVVKDEKALEAAKSRGEVYGQYFYHTDAPTTPTPDAKTYADQYKNGRQYLSGGVHGDGTYWSNSEDDSWMYGRFKDNAYQLKGMLNTNARVVKESNLTKMISTFERTHPKAAQVIRGMSNGYSRSSGTLGVYAALFGYNVIQSRQVGHDYLTVLDRSATTVVKGGHHYSDLGNDITVWKYR